MEYRSKSDKSAEMSLIVSILMHVGLLMYDLSLLTGCKISMINKGNIYIYKSA